MELIPVYLTSPLSSRAQPHAPRHPVPQAMASRPVLQPSEPAADAPTPSTFVLDGLSERSVSPMSSASTPRASSPVGLENDVMLQAPQTPRPQTRTVAATDPQLALQQSPFTRAFAASVAPYRIDRSTPPSALWSPAEALRPAFAMSPSAGLNPLHALASPRLAESLQHHAGLPGVSGLLLGHGPASANAPASFATIEATEDPRDLAAQGRVLLGSTLAPNQTSGLGISVPFELPDLSGLARLNIGDGFHEAYARSRAAFAHTPLMEVVEDIARLKQDQPQQAFLQLYALVNFCRHGRALNLSFQSMAPDLANWRMLASLLDNDRLVLFASLSAGLAAAPMEPLGAWAVLMRRLVHLDPSALWGLVQLVHQGGIFDQDVWIHGRYHTYLGNNARVVCNLLAQLEGVPGEHQRAALSWSAVMSLSLFTENGDNNLNGLGNLIEPLIAVPPQVMEEDAAALSRLEGLTLRDAGPVLWQLRQLPETERHRWPELWTQALWAAERHAENMGWQRRAAQMRPTWLAKLMGHPATRAEAFRYLKYDARIATETQRLNLGFVARSILTATMMSAVAPGDIELKPGTPSPLEVERLSQSFEDELARSLSPWRL